MTLRGLILSLALCCLGAVATAQTPPEKPPTEKPQETKPTAKPGQRPYPDVVTKEAVTQNGVFKVHRINDRILWEIPENVLGRYFVMQTEIVDAPYGTTYPGYAAGMKVIRFERRNNKIYMRNYNMSPLVTDDELGLKSGVGLVNTDPILASFDIQTEGEKGSPVIEVSSFFTSDPADFSVRSAVGGAAADPSRSFIDSVKSFPTNVETRSVLTFVAPRAIPKLEFGQPIPWPANSVTVRVHYSMVMLPEKPMAPRLKDSRIGYFTNGFERIEDNKPVTGYEYITRYRLEKKDPTAAVSEPVKPILYYISNEVPEKWRACIKEGVEAWQPAFEKAGFKNAILCRQAPTKAEDPNWDPEDARYNVIRWAPSKTANAMGPSLQDPRSGETISSHVIFWHNMIDLLQKWYFVQCGAIDPRTNHLPLSDAFLANGLRFVVTHEIGHTLGLEHNFKASVAYTIAELRNPEFVKNHGTSSSIMSYSRSNYVAQPGDGISYSSNDRLGPYDFFAIEYGYKPIPGTFKPEDEKPALDRLLAQQVKDKNVRFGNYRYSGVDPTTQSERIGDDAVEATRLGFLNLERVAAKLVSATSKFGDDYTYMSEMYDDINLHRILWLGHVMQYVGGVVESDTHAGRGGEIFKPVDAAYQRKAVNFLTTTGFQTPKNMFSSAIMNRLGPTGVMSGVAATQGIIFNSLLNEGRVKRILDNQAMYGDKAYSVDELVKQTFHGAWSELDAKNPKIDIYRRSLQMSLMSAVNNRLNGPQRTPTELRAHLRQELKNLAKKIDATLPAVKDKATALHLNDMRREIGLVVLAKAPVPAASANPFGFIEGYLNDAGCFGYGQGLREVMESVK